MGNLFECASRKMNIYYLGLYEEVADGTSYNSVVINVKNLVPDIDYSRLTADNFIIDIDDIPGKWGTSVKKSSSDVGYIGTFASKLFKEYDNKTGILTISLNITFGLSGVVDRMDDSDVSYRVYLVEGRMKEV